MGKHARILGIDYGERRIGLAYSESMLAEPLRVIEYSDPSEAIKMIGKICKKRNVELLVLGIPEGRIREQVRKFSFKLNNALDLMVVLWDESLTSQDAQALSIDAGIGRKRRRRMEDAYAAALILQDYLDSGDR